MDRKKLYERKDNIARSILSKFYFTKYKYFYDKYESNDWIFRCSGIRVIFQNFCFEKRPLVLNQKEVQSIKHYFEIELIFFEQLQLYCLESNLFLHANPWKCKNRTFFSFS